MTIRIEQGKDIFELNPGLGRLFPKLDNQEMEFVVYVADANSIFRMKPERERRELCLKIIDGCWQSGAPTIKGKKMLDGKNKDVESGILIFHKEINNNKQSKIMKTLDVMNNFYDELLGFMEKLDSTNKTDDQIKVFNANAKAIKDETAKETYQQIKYFEGELSHQFVTPDIAIEDTKDIAVVFSNTADNIDVESL